MHFDLTVLNETSIWDNYYRILLSDSSNAVLFYIQILQPWKFIKTCAYKYIAFPLRRVPACQTFSTYDASPVSMQPRLSDHTR